jgi:hypothetical protein
MDLPISFLSLQTKQRYLIITHAVLPGQMYPPVRGKKKPAEPAGMYLYCENTDTGKEKQDIGL